MASNPFEIKIAIVGNVSAGKTTVLNALLAAPLGEVAIKRTTAGLNYFRITSPDDKHIAPGDILKRIKALNERLHGDPKIEEEYFNVSMREPLLPTMRRNTQLVVVDIPGLNEAGTSKMYTTHVAKIWETFDCIICVMDVYQGVNTEEQVQLLKFVKENSDVSRSPVIILCNKVDEPENPEIQGLMTQMKEEVLKIGLAEADFFPISAQIAYLYRAAAGLREHESLDTYHIQRVCKEERGPSGLNMSSDQQRQLVFSIVHDPEQYLARLQRSNFPNLAAALNRLLGTIPLQTQALTRQMDAMHAHFQRKCAYGGVPVEQLKDCILCTWWDLWHEMKDDAMQSFRSDPNARERLIHLFELPQQAGEYPTKLGDSPKKISDAVKLLVKEKWAVIVDHIVETSPDGNPKWRFCLRDWSNIIESIMLMSSKKVFAKNFGRQIADVRFPLNILLSRGDPSESTGVLIPETPEDPKHWGHLEWLVCQYLKENDEAKLISTRVSELQDQMQEQLTRLEEKLEREQSERQEQLTRLEEKLERERREREQGEREQSELQEQLTRLEKLEREQSECQEQLTRLEEKLEGERRERELEGREQSELREQLIRLKDKREREQNERQDQMQELLTRLEQKMEIERMERERGGREQGERESERQEQLTRLAEKLERELEERKWSELQKKLKRLKENLKRGLGESLPSGLREELKRLEEKLERVPSQLQDQIQTRLTRLEVKEEIETIKLYFWLGRVMRTEYLDS